MFAFLALTSAESSVASAANHPLAYPIAYAVKIALVTAVAVWFRSAWRDLRPVPSLTVIVASVALGLGIAAMWVGLDGHYPSLPFLGKRSAFDPWTLSAANRWWFLAVRFFGLVLVVPLIEELFWRSFVMRWLIDPNFRTVPIGKVTATAAALTCLGFAIEHPEWLPALLTGAAWVGLLAWSKSVSACVISHMAANLALGVYVVAFGAWRFL